MAKTAGQFFTDSGNSRKQIIVSLPARNSLKAIHDYYKGYASLRIADKIKAGIAQKLKFIAQHPNAGQYEETLEHLGMGHRRIVEGNYKIVYRAEGSIIYVTDIFDSRRDPSKING